MVILVTGATGRVGSRVVRLLRHQLRDVRILARDAEKAAPLTELGVETVIGDVTDASVIADAVKGVDAVVHLVAVFRDMPGGPTAAEVNHDATVELARAALSAGVRRFVYCSTNQVYGPGRGRPARETDEPRPNRAYSMTKNAAEQSLLELHRTEGLPVRVLRPPVIYGDGDPRLAQQPSLCRDWPSHRRLQLVHHADVTRALISCIDAEGVDGEIFNVGDDAPISAWEIFRLNGVEPDPDAGDRELSDPWKNIVDSSKIRRMLGFRPIFPSVQSAMDAGAL